MRCWQDLTTKDFASLDLERTVALQPLGAIEQHGPHLPVSTDAVIAQGMAEMALRVLGDDVPALLLPTQSVGKSVEHRDYPGTLTLEADTLARVWTEIGLSVARSGVRRIVFLNAHGGQPQVMEIVARELRIHARMLAVTAGWWSVGLPEGLFEADELRTGIHGGDLETSVMLALAPSLVRMAEARNFRPRNAEVEMANEVLRTVGPVGMGWQAQDLHPEGVAGNAAIATAEKGQATLEHCGGRIAQLLREVSAYPLSALRVGPLIR